MHEKRLKHSAVWGKPEGTASDGWGPADANSPVRDGRSNRRPERDCACRRRAAKGLCKNKCRPEGVIRTKPPSPVRSPFSVAQIANLLCRRLPIGRALAEFRRSGQGAVLQDGILRYSRVAVCATNTGETQNTYPVRREREQPDPSPAASTAVGNADRRRTILPLPFDGRGPGCSAIELRWRCNARCDPLHPFGFQRRRLG